MYTSGTTGEPKGVLISNENIITLIAGVNRFLEAENEEVLEITLVIFFIVRKVLSICYTYPGLPMYFVLYFLQLTTEDVYLSYLPLAHIFDRVIEECFISHGARIGFWRGVSE